MAEETALDWALLRDFLVVAEAGSLSAGARELGVSQPTLSRRIQALERRFGAELFSRTSRGLERTEAGDSLLERARRIGEDVREIELAMTGRDAALAGPVRITATEAIALHWVTPVLAGFQAEHPAIEIDLVPQTQLLDLLRREADIAVRLGRPRQADLVARKACDLSYGLYASRHYLERHGRPEGVEDLAAHQGVGFDEALRGRGAAGWLEELLERGRIVFRSDSTLAQAAALRAGYGIGGQARYFADADPELERVIPELEVSIGVWLVTHAGLRRSARIRAVFDQLAQRFAADRDAFAGRGG
jgi:DNA-binding transcriptional LysR family regulator